MSKITEYSSLSAPNNADLLVIEDTVAGNTKKITRNNFLKGSPLPANTVDAQSITDGIITNNKLSATSGEVGGAWKSWTPTWSNFTVGNATVVTKYTQIGKTIHIRGKITLGSTSSVTGGIALTAPVNYNSEYNVRTVIGNIAIEDAGTASYFGYIRIADTVSTNLLQIGIGNAGGTYLSYTAPSSTIPMTWATGDQLTFTATYEAA